MTQNLHQRRETPSRQILEFIQRHGTVTIKELKTFLGVTTTAVRQHLIALQSEGYIDWQAVNDGVGRPHHVYTLTDKAREFFACNCDELALILLEEVFTIEGREHALMLLERVGARLARRYALRVRSNVLQERVMQLASTLEQRGVLTEVSVMDGDAVMLKTYNCPYHELAREHREICDMDEKMMGEILGAEVSLSSCLFDGHTGCSFVVRKNGKS